jgi:glycosyltransferase involved in cell wall biosynthesis
MLKNKIAIICDGWAGISSPLNNTIKILSEGNEVNVFYLMKPYTGLDQAIHLPKVILVKSELISETIFKRIKRKLLNVNQFEYAFANKIDFQNYDLIILMDKILKSVGYKMLFNKLKYYFFSLEIPNNVSFLERIYLLKVSRVFTQDDIRKKIISKYYGLRENKIRVIYNSSIGKAEKQSSNYFHDKFNLTPNSRILLMLGTISYEHGIDDFLKIVEGYKGDLIFVIHGWVTHTEILKKIQNNSQYKKRLFFSDEIVSFDDKKKLFNSATIGYVNFSSNEINYYYGAGSAGKLYDFMMAGIPILANNIFGMKEIIEKDNIGCIYSNIDEVSQKINYVLENYNLLSDNALKTFDKYNFEKSLKNAFE